MTTALSIDDFQEIGIGEEFQEILCVMLESSYLFKNFSRQELEQLVQYMHGYKAPKGAILFQEGERDSHLIIIIEGKAQILKDNGLGEMKEIAVVRKGATLGEMSVIDELSHSATVIAKEEIEIALITKTNLKNITEKFPALGVKLLWQIATQLSSRVRQASGQLVDHIN